MAAEASVNKLFANFPRYDQVTSPAVVLSAAAMSENLARVQTVAGATVAVHPHVKTHKSLELARRQVAAGAKGLTASKPWEAAIFIGAGLGPVTVAYPLIDGAAIRWLLRLGEENGVEVRFILDSEETLLALAEVARHTGRRPRSFIKVDVGLHRCGINPEGPDGLRLALALMRSSVEFLGLLSHAGHAYAARDPSGIRAVARQELEILHGFAEQLRAAGVEIPFVSIGSTPTILANAGFEGIDEIRPGNYIFNDLTGVRLEIATRDRIALAVSATVISSNSRYSIIDCGSKTLSSDLGPHGTQNTLAFGEVWAPGWSAPLDLVRLSEEHGFVVHEGQALAIGSRVLVLPNHACPVVNLASSMFELNGEIREIATDATTGMPHRKHPVSG